MHYNALVDPSPEKLAEFIEWLSFQTVAALKSAAGDSQALQQVIHDYFLQATTAKLAIEDIENNLGVNEPCIMDLAELSDEDEEIVITAFEKFTNE